jgi:hypothetical protein
MQFLLLVSIYPVPPFPGQGKHLLALRDIIETKFYGFSFLFCHNVIDSFLVKIKFCKSLIHSAIAVSYFLIPRKDFLLRASELAADAAIHSCIFVIEHIDVEVSHKAGWTSVI